MLPAADVSAGVSVCQNTGGGVCCQTKMSSEAPLVTGLCDTNQHVFEHVSKRFQEAFKESPTFFIRVPGRVNLIGEHIDYCGYSVLPMALDQCIVVAAKLIDESDCRSLRLVNVNQAYPDYSGCIDDLSFSLDTGVHWHCYVLCGIRGIAERMQDGRKLSGMCLAVAGDIPPNSGLSSSSALVSAAALTTAHANKVRLSRLELAALCATSERYIGTEGGGMDQAIAFLANSGCAKHISFKPIRAEDVALPAGVVIIVAHSLAEINKAAGDQFNCRVAECRLAALVLAQQSRISHWKNLRTLADVQAALRCDLVEMTDSVTTILTKDSYTKEEVCSILGVTTEELEEDFLPVNTRHINLFKLRQRAMHVFQEAARVTDFRDACLSHASPKQLGELMNASHDSLRDLYECSHPQLDQLVTVARESGALGARLTGAGWGGCVVALTTAEHSDLFMSDLKEKFYANLSSTSGKDLKSLVFSTKPGCSAMIYVRDQL